jgi:hypothetical protein
MSTKRFFLALGLGLGLALGLLWLLGDESAPVTAAGESTCQPAQLSSDVITVCLSGGCDYDNVQEAVDAASPGGVIKVAQGRYTGVSARSVPPDYPTPPAGGVITQVVYVSKTVTIQGGYTTTNWFVPYPMTQPTTLDAQRQGRVLLVTGDITPAIEGLHITDGDADGLGGAWWADGVVGGGVYLNATAATLSGNVIYSNTAAHYGGGLYLNDSDAALNANTISSNTVGSSGGGLYLHCGAPALNGNTINNNRAGGWGGGIDTDGDSATLNGNIVYNNIAEDYGGGVSLSSSKATLNNNLVYSNTAEEGGGISVYYSNAALSGNVIISNTAEDTGGGLRVEDGRPVFTNTVVADNIVLSAPEFSFGSGIFIRRSSPRFLHTTVARNSGGEGSGIYVTDDTSTYSTVALTNTIIFSHSVGISVTTGNTAILNATLWHANPISMSSNVVHINDHSGDPAFAADGYHLTFGSAAMDRGVNAGVTTDIDGEARPLGSGYDLGADEFPAKQTHLPLVLRNF